MIVSSFFIPFQLTRQLYNPYNILTDYGGDFLFDQNKIPRITLPSNENTKQIQINSFLDCTLAVENLMLEAWARQLDTCFSAWYPTVPEQVEQKVNEMLEIPKKWRIVTIIPLGYPIDPSERAFRLPATRNPLETLVCYEKFSK